MLLLTRKLHTILTRPQPYGRDFATHMSEAMRSVDVHPACVARCPRRRILSFTLVLLAPAAAVVWLGVRLVDEDRALAARQLRERRESAA